MVKGVNKSVIEINETGNKYFNKIILFVSPEFSSKSEKQLVSEADTLVKKLQGTSRESLRNAVIREKKRRRRIFLASITAFLVVVGVGLWLIL